MKNIDFKSLAIGALLTTTIFLGIAATGPLANGKVKLDGPVDVRLSFGGSGVSTTDSSTPTELNNRDTLNIKIIAGSVMDNWLLTKHDIGVDLDGIVAPSNLDVTLRGEVKTD